MACISALAALGMTGTASAIPIGYTCIGNCGTSAANGVVVAPPGGSTYDWVSTAGGIFLGPQDLNIGAETNGSILRSTAFTAGAGDALEFDFNFVTSDGAGFADYAWARLLDASLAPSALLFTARTTPGGNTSPGFGMPALNATLTPSSTPIVPGGPTWAPLAGSSGACFSTGCGYTGWIHSLFTIPTAGLYVLEFGSVNWSDTIYDTGLALTGTTIAGVPIGEQPPSVPEPMMLSLLIPGVAIAVRKLRRRLV